MINLSALSNFPTAAQTLGDLILITPNNNVGIQPQDNTNNPVLQLNPDSFFFNYQGEDKIMLTSDITDHYIEDNTAIQDQISLRPLKITVHGFIGELNDVVPELLKPVKFAADKLALLGAYTPELTEAALIAYNTAYSLYQTTLNLANNAVQTWNTLSGGAPIQNKQQAAFRKFYGYYNERRLFTVQTPWALFKDMAIESLNAIQGPEDKTISNFEIVFKKIKFASTTTIVSSNQPVGQSKSSRFDAANKQEFDFGTSAPPNNTSLLDKTKGFLGNL